MGPILRFSVHNLTSKSEHSLLTDHFYYSSDSLFILSIIHHRYKTTEGWSHLLKYLDIIQDASFKCFFVLRELKIPCHSLFHAKSSCCSAQVTSLPRSCNLLLQGLSLKLGIMIVNICNLSLGVIKLLPACIRLFSVTNPTTIISTRLRNNVNDHQLGQALRIFKLSKPRLMQVASEQTLSCVIVTGNYQATPPL